MVLAGVHLFQRDLREPRSTKTWRLREENVPRLLATDAAPTIRPPLPCLIIWMAAYLYEKKVPITLMSSMRWNSSVGAAETKVEGALGIKGRRRKKRAYSRAKD